MNCLSGVFSCRPVALIGRASDSKSGCWGFESLLACQSRPVTVVKKAGAIEKSKAVQKDPGVVQKSMQFLREVKIELKKVTWPTRKQTMGSTLVVVILVVIISLFLGLVDLGLSSLVRVVLP
jgi:preprotein translocase subunit SecE